MSNKTERFVSVLEKGRKWADVYDTSVAKNGVPGKKVAQVEATLAPDVVAALNATA